MENEVLFLKNMVLLSFLGATSIVLAGEKNIKEPLPGGVANFSSPAEKKANERIQFFKDFVKCKGDDLIAAVEALGKRPTPEASLTPGPCNNDLSFAKGSGAGDSPLFCVINENDTSRVVTENPQINSISEKGTKAVIDALKQSEDNQVTVTHEGSNYILVGKKVDGKKKISSNEEDKTKTRAFCYISYPASK